jgi:hypothetical protein
MSHPRFESIVDEDLASFARSGKGRESVIVEAARPAVGAPPAKAVRRTATVPADVLPGPRACAASAASERAVKSRRLASMIQLERALASLGLGDRARANHLAGAFTVEVTPSQLRDLAEQDSVQAIRKNRRRRLLGV